MDPAASSSQVSQYVTVMFAILQISETCKSTKLKIKATTTVAPDENPLDWPNAIKKDGVEDTGASNPISLQCLSQQYINNIRLASSSLSINFEEKNLGNKHTRTHLAEHRPQCMD